MRRDGWELELVNYLRESQSTAFTWGVADCALWVATFVDRITGSAWTDDWRGLYDSEEGALSLMAERGFANPEAIADAALESKPVSMAKRGDLVLHSLGALGLCDGRFSYFLTPERGLTPVLTIECKKAWTV